MRIQLLGPLLIDGSPAQLPPRDRIVLARLAWAVGDVVTTDLLVDALWGGIVPPSSGKVIQGVIMRLRRRLGPEAIETYAAGHRLAVAAIDVDVPEFRRLVARSRQLAEQGSIDRAAHAAQIALGLWRVGAGVELDACGVAPGEQARLRRQSWPRTS